MNVVVTQKLNSRVNFWLAQSAIENFRSPTFGCHSWRPNVFRSTWQKNWVDQNLLGIVRIIINHLIKNGHQSNDWKKKSSLPKNFWTLSKKIDHQIFGHQLSQPKMTTEFFQSRTLATKFFKQCLEFFGAMTKFFVIVRSTTTLDYLTKIFRATPKRYFGVPKFFWGRLKNIWSSIMVIKSCGN